MFLSREKGFTLSEILITLSIIGIVASMTIPALMNNIQDMQYKVAWKKAYSIMSQASLQVLSENGGTFKNLCGFFDSKCLKDKYAPYLNTSKLCDSWNGGTYGACWVHTGYYLDGTDLTDYDWDAVNSRAGAILNNGTFVLFMYQYNDGYKNWAINPYFGYVYVDINGFKGPNIISKDIYGFTLYEKTIMPFGIPGDEYGHYNTTCAAGKTGWGCSAKYLQE